MPVDNNPEYGDFGNQQVRLESLIQRLNQLKKENRRLKKDKSKAIKKYRKAKEMKLYSAELIKFQEYLEAQNRRMIILFEGRDAAGKGGAIQRITHYMNERHYRVVALGRPTEEQQGQWFFQKYIEEFPRGGEIVLFDRSWYNRAMVEPVFNFCTEEEHQNFMLGVTGFERDLVRQGTLLIKFYFSVGRDVQSERFEIRKTNPLKQWKLSEVDLQAQERWAEFTQRKFEMLRRTHTNETPWTIIRADNKHRARINAIKVILNSLDYAGRNERLSYLPDPEVVVSGSQELELMNAVRIRGGF
ncbi:MAG: polyphosphate kinase 2 [Gammaproteobacteria bacterium]|nr:polyphosphate kinase 2 [Gammaproteobacteria bacterium]